MGKERFKSAIYEYNSDRQSYGMGIYGSKSTHDWYQTTILKSVDWNEINNTDRTEIDFCIADGVNTLYDCAGAIYSSNWTGDIWIDGSFLKNKRLTADGDKCYTFVFFPGLIIEDRAAVGGRFVGGYVTQGNKCVINKANEEYESTRIKDCCLNQNCKDSNFSNGFQTSHCDQIMTNYCPENLDNPSCLEWLYTRVSLGSSIPLDMYFQECKNNFDNIVCDYLCAVSRNENFGQYGYYCDRALDYYCNNNPSNSNCSCYMTKKNKDIPDIMTDGLGPVECWLADCNVKLKSQKWLTTDQLVNKSKCNIVNCVITIDQITTNKDAIINLKNNCTDSSYSFLSLEDDTETFYKEQSWGTMLNVFIVLIVITILLLLIAYYITKPIKIKYLINKY